VNATPNWLVDLLDVVHQAEGLPLAVYLGFAPEREAAKTQNVTDVGEDRFHRERRGKLLSIFLLRA